MKIFLSWSGDQAKRVAEFLKGWLPAVLASPVETFVSSQDIAKGERGLQVIAQELDQSDFGIAIVTKTNVSSTWVNFEAGALAKAVDKGRVATLLIDITHADITGPLAQFQYTRISDRADVRQLLRDIAVASGSDVPVEALDSLFDSYWPKLEAELTEITSGAEPVTERSEKELLEEVLEIVRSLRRKPSDPYTPAGSEGYSLVDIARAQSLVDVASGAGSIVQSILRASGGRKLSELEKVQLSRIASGEAVGPRLSPEELEKLITAPSSQDNDAAE